MWGGAEPRDRRDGQGGPATDDEGNLVAVRREPDYLKVTTTRMRPGYLQKNGVPYSERTTVTEHFTRFTHPVAGDWFVVTTVVEDPQYLTQPFITSTNFKKESTDAKFKPAPCKT